MELSEFKKKFIKLGVNGMVFFFCLINSKR